jgi:ubiquinone/menaquinone biosynthesis C-methylase UbiE
MGSNHGGWGGSNLKCAFDHKCAQHYDEWYQRPGGAQVLQMERELIKRYLDPRPGERILDIGSGTGIHLEWFRDLGLQVTGLDASPYMLERARSRLRESVDLHIGWAEHLPFEDNEFELSALINTLEFVEDPEKALAEAFRVTRRRVVLGVLNKYAFMAINRRLKGLIRDSIYRQARFFSVWELKEMIARILGPTPVRWGTVIFFPLSLSKVARTVEGHPFFQQNPLGAFIAMQVDISYRFITCKDHLTTPLQKKHGQLPQGTLKVYSPPPAWKEKRPPEAILRP